MRTKSRPVAVVLRPGKTPGGVEVRAHLRRLVRHIRTRWHKTRITFRGDGHYWRTRRTWLASAEPQLVHKTQLETTSRVRLAFAAACPEADLFRSLPGALLPLGP